MLRATITGKSNDLDRLITVLLLNLISPQICHLSFKSLCYWPLLVFVDCLICSCILILQCCRDVLQFRVLNSSWWQILWDLMLNSIGLCLVDSNSRWGGGQVSKGWQGSSELRTLAALLEDLSQIPNTHVWQLKVFYNSSFKDLMPYSGFCRHLQSCVHALTHRHVNTHTHKHMH